MVKVVRFRFQQCLLSLTCCFPKEPMKGDFLEICLTTFFGVCNFDNTTAMRSIFFWKCSKFKLDFKNAKTNWNNVICFWDNFIWIGCPKLSLLRREYFSLADNVLRNSLKNFCITKRDFSEINSLNIDQ